MTGVLVVEDQQMLASALEVAISVQPDLDCLGTASTVDDALAKIAVRVPDVVLMDVELPGMDGIEGTRLIKSAYPEVRVLVLTGGATPERLAAAAAAGAAGFLDKDTPFHDVLAAIRNPLPGKVLVEGAVLHSLLRTEGAPPPPSDAEPRSDESATSGTAAAPGLTARESQILELMGRGLDPAAIAERLVLSVHTVRGHVKNVMMKLGAHTQLEAVVLATRLGLLEPDRGPAEDPVPDSNLVTGPDGPPSLTRHGAAYQNMLIRRWRLLVERNRPSEGRPALSRPRIVIVYRDRVSRGWRRRRSSSLERCCRLGGSGARMTGRPPAAAGQGQAGGAQCPVGRHSAAHRMTARRPFRTVRGCVRPWLATILILTGLPAAAYSAADSALRG